MTALARILRRLSEMTEDELRALDVELGAERRGVRARSKRRPVRAEELSPQDFERAAAAARRNGIREN